MEATSWHSAYICPSGGPDNGGLAGPLFNSYEQSVDLSTHCMSTGPKSGPLHGMIPSWWCTGSGMVAGTKSRSVL